MVPSKKAQSAIEFLMTYGWAFMMAFLMIGALFYFGIFDVSKLLPEKCEFASEFDCSAFTLVEDSGYDANPPDGALKVKLVNNLGVEIQITNCSVGLGALPTADFCKDDDAQDIDLDSVPAGTLNQDGTYNCGAGDPLPVGDPNRVVTDNDQVSSGDYWAPGTERIFYFSQCRTSEYGMQPNSKQELILTFEYKAVQSVYKHNITGRIVSSVTSRE